MKKFALYLNIMAAIGGLFHSSPSRAGFYQRMMQKIDHQLDIYFILRNADQSCLSMFIDHLTRTNELMANSMDQSIRAWDQIGIVPMGGDRYWYQYLKNAKLIDEHRPTEIKYEVLQMHLHDVKSNAGLFFQQCLKDVLRMRLACIRTSDMEQRQDLNECIKNGEQQILRQQTIQARYFARLPKDEREELEKAPAAPSLED